jgi:hypothetical protein
VAPLALSVRSGHSGLDTWVTFADIVAKPQQALEKGLAPGVAGYSTPRWHRRIRRSKPEPVNKQSCQHKYCDEDDGLGADVLKDNQWSLHTLLRRLANRSRPHREQQPSRWR